MLNLIKWAFIGLLGISEMCYNPGDHVSGKVVRVLDGDTYDLLLDNKTIRVRMEEICLK
jgi:endonuclease YncB( thermonuclease family)